MIGYMIPAWGFASGTPGLFNNDTCYQDMHGHGHKLESESAGPTSANDIANALSGLLARRPDPSAQIVMGRYVLANGTYSHWPTGAVGILIPPAGRTALDPSAGLLIGAPATAAFGGRRVDANGVFMDYDGQPQARPDVTTRGMMVLGTNGCVKARYYLNVFPALDSSHPLGGAVSQAAALPRRPCRGARLGRRAGAAAGRGGRRGAPGGPRAPLAGPTIPANVTVRLLAGRCLPGR